MMFTYFTTKRPLSHLNNENVRKISLWLELILLKTKNYFSISFSFDHRSDHAVESTTSKKNSLGYFVANWNACPTQKYYTWKFSTQISSAKWCEKIQIIVCLLASVNGSSHYDVSSTLKCRLIEREREKKNTREWRQKWFYSRYSICYGKAIAMPCGWRRVFRLWDPINPIRIAMHTANKLFSDFLWLVKWKTTIQVIVSIVSSLAIVRFRIKMQMRNVAV